MVNFQASRIDRRPDGSGRFGFVDAVDLEVVDLIQRVVPGVQHRGHDRSDQRVDDQIGVPRFPRRRAVRGCRARHEAERRRDERERPAELEQRGGRASEEQDGRRTRRLPY